MSTIVTRAGKGSQLSWTEVDSNFTNLNTDKIESSNSGTTGQVLTKTSGGAEWATAAGGSKPQFMINCDLPEGTLISGSTYRQTISEVFDTDNLITVTSNQFTLAAGTYLVIMGGAITSNTTTSGAAWLRNVTGNADIGDQWQNIWPSTGTFTMIVGGKNKFTLSTSSTMEFRVNNGSQSLTNRGAYYLFTKLA